MSMVLSCRKPMLFDGSQVILGLLNFSIRFPKHIRYLYLLLGITGGIVKPRENNRCSYSSITSSINHYDRKLPTEAFLFYRAQSAPPTVRRRILTDSFRQNLWNYVGPPKSEALRGAESFQRKLFCFIGEIFKMAILFYNKRRSV